LKNHSGKNDENRKESQRYHGGKIPEWRISKEIPVQLTGPEKIIRTDIQAVTYSGPGIF
jgi:hypothetical protein